MNRKVSARNGRPSNILPLLTGALGIYLIWQGSLFQLISLTLATVDTFRALRSVHSNGRRVGVATRRKAIKGALTSWIVSAAVKPVDEVFSKLLGWIPFYAPVRLSIYLGFIALRIPASTTIYESLLRPLFKQYETPIDLILLLLNSISAIVIHYLIVLPSYRVFGIYDRIRSRISPGVVGDKEYPIEISDDGSQEDVSGIIVTRIISDVSTPKVPGALLRSTRKSARKEMVPKSPIFIKDIPTSILPVASGRHGTPRPQSTAQLGSSSTPLSTFPSSDKTPLYPAIPAFIIPNPTAQPASTIPQPTSNTQPLIPIPSHSRVSQIPNVSKTIPPRIKTRPVKPLDTTSAVSQKRPTTLKVRKDPSLPVSRLDLAPKIKERGPVRAALSLQKDVKRAKVNGKRNVDEMEDDSGKKLDRKGKGVMEGERNVEEIRKALGGKRIKRDVESVIPLERKIVSKVVEDEGAGVGLKGKKRKAEDEPKDINRMMKKVDVGTRLREDEKTVPPRRVMRSRVVREI